MADRNGSDRIEAEDPAHVRRQLTKRMVLAATIIFVLLGALTVFDHLSNLSEPEEAFDDAPLGAPPVGPSLRSEDEPEEAPVPAAPPAPESEPPPKPEIPAQPSALAVAPRPAAPRPAPAPSVGVPEGSAIPEQAIPAPPVPQAPPPAPRRAARFVLQAGVFSSHERAEELMARLVAAGIPASIESRVHVGPFASKKEADAARAKMKTLGIDALLLRRAAPAGGPR